VSTSALASRTLTIIASSFLGFDGAALVGLGWWSGRASLVAVGVALFLGSGLVFVLWRRQLRRLDEIAAARRELREETESLRRLLGG
jgi:hypothetical protein